MKRRSLLLPLAVVLTLLVAGGVQAKPKAAKAKPEAAVKEELLKLMAETKSPKAFLVAAEAAVMLDPKDLRVIPAILRNAERLGVFDAEAGSSEVEQAVLELVKELLEAREASSGRPQAAELSPPADRYSTPPTYPGLTVPTSADPLLLSPPAGPERLEVMPRVADFSDESSLPLNE